MKVFEVLAGVSLALFCLLHTAEAHQMAFAWAHQSSVASYTPSLLYSYNAGQPIEITRSAAGRYSVAFGRVADGGAHVQVSMYGGLHGHCSVGSWFSGTVNVNCYDLNGRYADRQFNVLAIEACGEEEEYLSYAWLHRPSTDRYYASAGYRFGDGTFLVKRSSVGRYNANLGSPVGLEAAVLVSAYSSNEQCSVINWSGDIVNLQCRDPQSQALSDSRATVLAIKAGFPHASFVWNYGTGLGESWSHSSDSSSQSITRTETGRYTVMIGPEADVRGHIQVVAYNSPATCWVSSWGSGVAYIRCGRNGSDFDSAFVALAIA